ncbi:MAG TPA: MBL fold metallo-hydrolase, partial [Candidatus Angelobacter sp.]
AVIISTYQTRSDVLRSLREQAAQVGQQAPPEYLLNQTFLTNRGPTLFVGGHEVQIYYPGPAHTMGDAVVYFPDQHAIATGDLFLTNSCPAMDDGDMENWIAALDHMLALPLEHIVPGHFELATKSELQRFRNYLTDLRHQVARMHRNGLSLDRVQKLLVLDAYKDFRQFPQYEATFKDNAAVYYKQLERPIPTRRGTH